MPNDPPPLSSGNGVRELFAPLGELMASREEPGRYRLLAELLLFIADHPGVEGGIRSAAAAEIVSLRARVNEFESRVADLEDALRMALADRTTSDQNLQAATAANQTLRETVDRLRERLTEEQRLRRVVEVSQQGLQTEVDTLRSQLAAARQTTHQLLGDVDDSQRVRQLEQTVNSLRLDLQAARDRAEEIRQRKDAEIADVQSRLAQAAATVAQPRPDPSAEIWSILSAARPAPKMAYADAGRTPALVHFQRMAAVFVLLADFARTMEHLFHPGLAPAATGSSRAESEVEAFLRLTVSPPLGELLRSVVHAERPIEFLRPRLQRTLAWAGAYAAASNHALNVADRRLESHLDDFRARDGARPKTPAEYARMHGPEDFRGKLLLMRAENMPASFGELLAKCVERI